MRMLVATRAGPIRAAARADRRPGGREHHVDAQGPEQGALARHVRAGHDERPPGGRQRHVVVHPARRPATSGCPSAARRQPQLGRQLGPREGRVLEGEARRGSPAPRAPRAPRASRARWPPARERQASSADGAVHVPHHQRPEQEPEHLVPAGVDEAHDALERTRSPGSLLDRSPTSRARGCTSSGASNGSRLDRRDHRPPPRDGLLPGRRRREHRRQARARPSPRARRGRCPRPQARRVAPAEGHPGRHDPRGRQRRTPADGAEPGRAGAPCPRPRPAGAPDPACRRPALRPRPPGPRAAQCAPASSRTACLPPERVARPHAGVLERQQLGEALLPEARLGGVEQLHHRAVAEDVEIAGEGMLAPTGTARSWRAVGPTRAPGARGLARGTAGRRPSALARR